MNYHLNDLFSLTAEVYGVGQYKAQRNSSLTEILNSMKLTFLKVFAERVLPDELYFESKKYKKRELIQCIIDYLLSDSFINLVLIGSSNEQLDIITKLINDHKVSPYVNSELVRPLYFCGLIYVDFSDEDDISFILPIEYKEILESKVSLIDKRERDKSNNVSKYIKAMVNLYGVITPTEALDIYNYYNPAKKMKLENFLKYVIFTQAMRKEVFIFEDLIYAEYIEFSYDDPLEFIIDILHHREGKPFYLPSKEEFEKYQFDEYFEANIALTKLSTFIKNKLTNKREADELYKAILTLIRADESNNELFKLVSNFDVMFSSEDELRGFIELLVVINNNSRKWYNAGHSPMEIKRFYYKT